MLLFYSTYCVVVLLTRVRRPASVSPLKVSLANVNTRYNAMPYLSTSMTDVFNGSGGHAQLAWGDKIQHISVCVLRPKPPKIAKCFGHVVHFPYHVSAKSQGHGLKTEGVMVMSPG